MLQSISSVADCFGNGFMKGFGGRYEAGKVLLA